MGQSNRSMQVDGKNLRFTKISQFDIPAKASGWGDVFTITERGVLYKMVFEVNSDNIHVQMEFDGTEIFPSPDGVLLEDLEDLALTSGISSGYYGGTQGDAAFFGFFQYSSNKWMWVPPDPLFISANFKLKMKSNGTSTSRDVDGGLVLWRSLDVDA